MPQLVFPQGAAVNADDVHLSRSAASYLAATTATVSVLTGVLLQWGRSNEGASFTIRQPLIRWDTSLIPDDATIDSASFSVYANHYGGSDSLSVVADAHEWTGVAADWMENAPTTPILNVPLSTFSPQGAIKTASFSTLDWINKSGYSYFRGMVTKLSGDAAPTGFNYNNFAAIDDASLQEPRLIVNYTLPADTTPPAAPTWAATNPLLIVTSSD